MNPNLILALLDSGGIFIDAAKKELKEQGHSLTGKAADSLIKSVKVDGNKMTLIISGIDYLESLNTGVPANRIPFTPGGPRQGGTSLYIAGLIEFAIRRGMAVDEKSALRIAFAIAHKHKIQWSSTGFGMPTSNAYQFSSNGARTGWVEICLKNTKERILKRIIEAYIGQFRLQFKEIPLT